MRGEEGGREGERGSKGEELEKEDGEATRKV